MNCKTKVHKDISVSVGRCSICPHIPAIYGWRFIINKSSMRENASATKTEERRPSEEKEITMVDESHHQPQGHLSLNAPKRCDCRGTRVLKDLDDVYRLMCRLFC